MNPQAHIHITDRSFQTRPSLLQKCAGAIVSLVLLAATLHPASVLAQVVRTSVGTPAWQPTDIHLFFAPIGTAQSNFAEILTTLQTILPEPNHRFHPDLFIGPGDPHTGPYTQEISNGLASSGFQEKTIYDASDFSGANGIYLTMMNVPGFGVTPAAQGSSPDFASGPIIPNSLFPISALGTTFRNGSPLPAFSAFGVPPLDGSLNPPFNVDGHSHFPLNYIDNADFNGVDPEGTYVYSVSLRDTAGNGWDVSVPFQVVPEPGASLLLAVGAIGILSGRRQRARR